MFGHREPIYSTGNLYSSFINHTFMKNIMIFRRRCLHNKLLVEQFTNLSIALEIEPMFVCYKLHNGLIRFFGMRINLKKYFMVANALKDTNTQHSTNFSFFVHCLRFGGFCRSAQMHITLTHTPVHVYLDLWMNL